MDKPPAKENAVKYDDDDTRWEINGHNACRAETIAAINRLFEQEPSK